MPASTGGSSSFTTRASAEPSAGTLSAEGENEGERLVHCSHLARTQAPLEVIQSPHVQRAQLLHHHPRSLPGDAYLRSEARRLDAWGGRRDEHGRKPEQLVCLDEYGIARPVLLMAATRRQPHAEDVAARHSGHSAPIASMSAITRSRSARSRGWSASRATSAASPDRLRSRSAVSAIAWRAASARVTPACGQCPPRHASRRRQAEVKAGGKRNPQKQCSALCTTRSKSACAA